VTAAAVSVPREHGFWTMLTAVVFAALARSKPSFEQLLVAAAVVAAAILLGGVFARSIRRHGTLQLASAVTLALAGIPIELVGGNPPRSVALTALAWAVVFASSALGVRAAFARASRTRRSQAEFLQRGSEAIAFAATLFFLGVGAIAQATAALVAAAGCVALGVTKPGVKQMKAVGLLLAGVAAIAAGALSFI